MNIHSDEISYEAKLLSTFEGRRLFIMPGTTNGSYGIDTLATIAMMRDCEAVLEGAVFAFCHKSEKQIRFLVWDDGGYWLITRKIYNNTFVWPEKRADEQTIKATVGLIKLIINSAGSSRSSIIEQCLKMGEN